MKAWKIIYSIICLPIIGFMIYQTNTISKWSNDIGGVMGYIVAAVLCAIVVVSIVSLKVEKKTILNIVIGGLGIAGAIFGFIGCQDLFKDLLVYAIWSLICGAVPLAVGIVSLVKEGRK